MFTKDSATSLATVRSGTMEESGELVVAAAYHKDGRYGYFITHEQKTTGGFMYSDPLEFFPKTSEKAYKEAVARLRDIVEQKL